MIHELISSRRSIRAFADKSIDDETLIGLFEAARWASSSMNEQPWRFILAKKEDKETFEKMLQCLNEPNRVWAKDGAALIIVLAKTSFSSNHVPNRHAFHDVGLAVGNLSLQATALHLYLHQMGGFDREKTKQLFEIPEGFEVISFIVAGYEGDSELLPEHLRERELKPRVRKNLDELIFSKKFGEENALVKQFS